MTMLLTAAVTCTQRCDARRRSWNSWAAAPVVRQTRQAGRRVAGGAGAPPLAQASGAPDHVLHFPGEAEVHLFGVEHLSLRPEVGDYILSSAPASVVVETAVTPAHGRAAGARLTAQDLGGSEEEWHRIALNLVAHLQASLADHEADRTLLPLWQQVRVSAPAEQVALVAALVVNAPLVNGDRTKEVTFRRLMTCSAAQLDAAFGMQAAANYGDIVQRNGGMWPASASPGDDVFDKVVLHERDAVLYHSLRSEAKAVGEGQHVVGIVGSAHVDAIAALHAAASPALDDVASLLHAPEVQEDPTYGCRRAIMERLLLLRCPPEMVAAAQEDLGEVGFSQAPSYEDTHECYASSRMLLACLTKEQLAAVASVRRGQPEFWEVLQPLRNVRPSLGGTGYSDQALDMLRKLTPVL